MQQTPQMGGIMDILKNAAEDIIAGRRIDKNKVARSIAEAAFQSGGSFAEFHPDLENIDWDQMFTQARARFRQATGFKPPPGWNQQQAQPDPNAELRAAEQRARQVLGFGPRDAITKDALKARHRALAMKNHPDRGGSVERMQQINAAVDTLSAVVVG